MRPTLGATGSAMIVTTTITAEEKRCEVCERRNGGLVLDSRFFPSFFGCEESPWLASVSVSNLAGQSADITRSRR